MLSISASGETTFLIGGLGLDAAVKEPDFSDKTWSDDMDAYARFTQRYGSPDQHRLLYDGNYPEDQSKIRGNMVGGVEGGAFAGNFTEEALDREIDAIIDKINNGSIKEGDSVFLALNTHGLEKKEYSTSMACRLDVPEAFVTEEVCASVDRDNPDTNPMVDLPHLVQILDNDMEKKTIDPTTKIKRLQEAMEGKGIHLGVWDGSCYSGAIKEVANDFTCVVTATSSQTGAAVANGGFTGEGLFESISEGRTMEDVFLLALQRNKTEGGSFDMPEISTDVYRKIQAIIRDPEEFFRSFKIPLPRSNPKICDDQEETSSGIEPDSEEGDNQSEDPRGRPITVGAADCPSQEPDGRPITTGSVDERGCLTDHDSDNNQATIVEPCRPMSEEEKIAYREKIEREAHEEKCRQLASFERIYELIDDVTSITLAGYIEQLSGLHEEYARARTNYREAQADESRWGELENIDVEMKAKAESIEETKMQIIHTAYQALKDREDNPGDGPCSKVRF